MILYRAMCEKEAKDTLKHRYPAFVRRWKWFSHDANFVTGRVQDGCFGNSDVKPGRYSHLVRFEIPDDDCRWFTRGQVEWALDRRVSHQVHWINVEEA